MNREERGKSVSRYSLGFFFILLLISGINIAGAQGWGWRYILQGREKYHNGEFAGAIEKLDSAFYDPSLSSRESTVAYFYLAFSYIKLDEREMGYEYFEKILTCNPDEKLREGFEEFEVDFEIIRSKIEREKMCSVTINSNPEGATVYLDGGYKVATPTTLSGVLKGRNYELMIQKSGYEPVIMPLLINNDTSLTIVLQKTPPPPPIRIKYLYTLPDMRSLLVGASTGAALGLTAALLSVYFGDKAQEKIDLWSVEQDPEKMREYDEQIRRYDFWRSLSFYSSYPLTTVGFYIGLKLSERLFPAYAQLNNEKSGIRVCCSIDRNLNPVLNINIRRDIW